MHPTEAPQFSASATAARVPARILYIDDDPLQANLGKRVLESVGHQVDAESSPLDALAAVGADPYKYDLVITDQRMPELVGVGLSEEIHALRSDLPIMLVTGDSSTLAKTAELSQMFHTILPKPVSAYALRAAVAAVFAR